MPELRDIIKNRVRDLPPYSLRLDRARIKLNQNENAWGVPEEIRAETLRRLANRHWSRYPDFVPGPLHETLAEFSGWRADGVLTGNGSNEMIQALLMVSVGAGKRVLISEPTFLLYRHLATILDGQIESVPLTPDLTYDVMALQASLRTFDPDVTIICSPNNPTGCGIAPRDLESLLTSCSGLFVIDEAYFEFAGQTAVALLQRFPNLIVLRTFSKAMALAGLRIGYLLGAPELVRQISKAILPGNLDIFSETAAQVAIELYDSRLKPQIDLIIQERERLAGQLSLIPGLTPVPSKGNFMIVRSSIEPTLVLEELLNREILIRDMSKYPMLKDYFRVTVGQPEENDELIASLREIFDAGR
jgi:histidinol-phosphate aminotransferase